MSKFKIILPLLVGALSFQTEAQAQQPKANTSKIFPQINKENHVVKTIRKSNLHAVKRKNAAAKPSADATSAKALTIGWYNFSGSVFEYDDSLRFEWHDTFGRYFDYVSDMELDILPEKPYDLRSPRERIEQDYLGAKMDSIALYEWNDMTETYESYAEYKVYNTIDANDFITNTNQYTFDGNDYTEEFASEYIYDSEGKIIEIIFSFYNGSTLEILGKDTFSYDTNGNLIFEGWSLWNSTNYDLSNYTEYEYNTNNLVIKATYYYYDNVNFIWVENYADEYTYDTNDNLISLLYQYNPGGGLENSELMVYEYSGSNQLLSYVALNWDDNLVVWDSIGKSTYTYGSGNMPETETIAEYSGSGWDETTLFNYYHNSNDELDSILCQEIIGSTNVNYLFIKYNRNEHGQIEVIESKSQYNPLDSTWSLGGDDVLFTLYYDIDTTINIKKINNTLEVSVYPNPASDQITINTGNEKINAINIYDNMGRLVKQQRINQSQKEITVTTSNLSNGTYTVQIIGDQKQGNKQIVIAR